MFLALKERIRRAGRRLALTGAGAILALVGVAFLTGAVFLALAASLGAIVACLVVGGFYFGLGCLVMALGSRRPIVTHPVASAATPVAAPKGVDMAGPLAGAFVMGLQNGMAARAHRPRPL